MSSAVERKLNARIKKRERKRTPQMPVTGKQVFSLQQLLAREKKPRRGKR